MNILYQSQEYSFYRKLRIETSPKKRTDKVLFYISKMYVLLETKVGLDQRIWDYM